MPPQKKPKAFDIAEIMKQAQPTPEAIKEAVAEIKPTDDMVEIVRQMERVFTGTTHDEIRQGWKPEPEPKPEPKNEPEPELKKEPYDRASECQRGGFGDFYNCVWAYRKNCPQTLQILCRERSDRQPTTPNLTKEQIYQMFLDEYVEDGYIYSGSIPANHYAFYGNRANYERLWELEKEGKIVRRECEAVAFQLPVEKRLELIREHNLDVEWQKKAPFFYPNGPKGEVTEVKKEVEALKAPPSTPVYDTYTGWICRTCGWRVEHGRPEALRHLKENTGHDVGWQVGGEDGKFEPLRKLQEREAKVISELRGEQVKGSNPLHPVEEEEEEPSEQEPRRTGSLTDYL